MGRIIVSENTTIDGVVQDPTGEEGFRRGGWFTRVTERDRQEWASAALAEVLDAQALLLGRRTCEFFAARWPSRTGPLADRLNGMTKYVASSTVREPDWANCSMLTGDVVSEVADLKRNLDGDLVLYASFQLVRTLVQHSLVDEFRFTLYPYVLGTGNQLLGDYDDQIALRLNKTRSLGDNLVVLTYEIARTSSPA